MMRTQLDRFAKLGRRKALALALAVAVAGVGCASVPQTHYYVLEWPADVAPEPTAVAGGSRRIGVQPFSVDPPYDQDRIVYRVGDQATEIGFYAYHRWAVPLGRMLPALTAQALERSADVGLAEPLRAGGDYDVVVEGRLRRLEEIDEPSGPKVRVLLELSWHDGQGVTLGNREAGAELAADTPEVGEVVRSMAEAVAAALLEALAEPP